MIYNFFFKAGGKAPNATGTTKSATSSSPTKGKGKGSTYVNTKPFIPSGCTKHGHTDQELLERGYRPLGAV